MTKKSKKLKISSPLNKAGESQRKIYKEENSTHQKVFRDSEPLLCPDHSILIEFICTFRTCLKEMCSHCIISHKEHIHEVQPILKVMSKELSSLKDNKNQNVKDLIAYSQESSLFELDRLSESLRNVLRLKLDTLREKLIAEDEHFKRYLTGYEEAREVWPDRGVKKVGRLFIDRFKSMLQIQRSLRPNNLIMEKKLIESDIKKMLSSQISFLPQGVSLNTTRPGVDKILHWFEWEKRDLHLYNVTEYSYRIIKLAIYFKIPCFSRSILIPDGRIYLIGGEDAESGPKREVFSTSITSLASDCTLHRKTSMIYKRYDFSICYFNNFIYAIAGKDSYSEVTDEVEKYDVIRDRWIICAPVLKKRYAGSATIQVETEKIYLFGGRSDDSTQLIVDIEEYDIRNDLWTLIKLSSNSFWIPVEVCACIQISMDNILIFGGSDSYNEDSNTAYIFKPSIRTFEKTSPLRKGHVFVNSPFLHGNYIFAVGNEYYVKSRRIQRFEINRKEWDFLS